MGIRLQCPNGHKVNVKSFLAGKRGVCPQCGVKFDIPATTGIVTDDNTGDEIATVPAAGGEPADVASQAAGSAATQPMDVRKARPGKSPADRSGLIDPATLDLDAIAAAGGTSLLGGQAFGPAGRRLEERRKSAHSMRIFTLALVVAVTLLSCVLLYLVFRGR